MQNAYKRKNENNEDDKDLTRVCDGYNTYTCSYSFLTYSLVSNKGFKKKVQGVAKRFSPSSDNRDKTIGQLVKKCNYGQGEVFEDCELGYSFGIGNTDVYTSRSFLYV